MSRIVCDTGPLISLEKVTGGHASIRTLYARLLVPPAVLEEVSQGVSATTGDYLQAYDVADLFEVRAPTLPLTPGTQHLDRGEREAITLALQLGLPLLIEETAGREAARRLGLSISGIAGQLLKAAREGAYPPTEAAERLAELHRAGRINQRVYDAVKERLSPPRPGGATA